MAYIVEFYDRTTFEWHVQDKKPLPENVTPAQAFRDVFVTLLRADNDELDFIRLKFKNVPITQGSSGCLWKGEWAQFLYDNL